MRCGVRVFKSGICRRCLPVDKESTASEFCVVEDEGGDADPEVWDICVHDNLGLHWSLRANFSRLLTVTKG